MGDKIAGVTTLLFLGLIGLSELKVIGIVLGVLLVSFAVLRRLGCST